jgi:hypothetical protein
MKYSKLRTKLISVKEKLNHGKAGRFGSRAIETLRAKDIQMIIPENQITINEILKNCKQNSN